MTTQEKNLRNRIKRGKEPRYTMVQEKKRYKDFKGNISGPRIVDLHIESTRWHLREAAGLE